jgi:hypothetical protein
MKKVTFEFETDDQAEEFVTWLCEQGEQDYWLWMEATQERQEYMVAFDYHTSAFKGNSGKLNKGDVAVLTRKMRIE